MPTPSTPPTFPESVIWLGAPTVLTFLVIFLTADRSRLGRPTTSTLLTALAVHGEQVLRS